MKPNKFICTIMLGIATLSSICFATEGIKGSALPTASTGSIGDTAIIVQDGVTKKLPLGNIPHNNLSGRTATGAHTTGAIIGLDDALAAKQNAFTNATSLDKIGTGGDGNPTWSGSAWPGGTGSGVSDHGELDGLSDDDHPQYHNDTRGDERYVQQSYTSAGGGRATNDEVAAGYEAKTGITYIQGAVQHSYSGASISSGSNEVTFSDITCSAATHVGRYAVIQNAGGSGGQNLVSEITGCNSGKFVLTDNAAVTVSSARGIIARDDTPTVQAVIDAYSGSDFTYPGLTIHFSSAVFLKSSAAQPARAVLIDGKNNITITGPGTIYFNDTIAFMVDGGTRLRDDNAANTRVGNRFIGLTFDGMESRYLTGAVAPVYSTAIGFGSTRGAYGYGGTYEEWVENQNVDQVKFFNMKRGIDAFLGTSITLNSTTGVITYTDDPTHPFHTDDPYAGHLYITNIIAVNRDVPDSIAICSNGRDSHIHNVYSSGPQIGVLLGGPGYLVGGTRVSSVHTCEGMSHDPDAVVVIKDATATGGSANTLVDSNLTHAQSDGLPIITDEYIGQTITITAGTGSGQSRTVSANTATSFTVSVNWTTQPDSTSVYTVTGTISDVAAIFAGHGKGSPILYGIVTSHGGMFYSNYIDNAKFVGFKTYRHANTIINGNRFDGWLWNNYIPLEIDSPTEGATFSRFVVTGNRITAGNAYNTPTQPTGGAIQFTNPTSLVGAVSSVFSNNTDSDSDTNTTSSLKISEVDGAPAGYIHKLNVPNASLTDEGDGEYTLSISGSASLPTGAAGDFLYYTGSEWDDTDGSKLFWDDSAGKLGIGITSPEGVFHAKGATSSYFERTSSGTNAVGTALSVTRSTTAGMVDGFGAATTFFAKDNAGGTVSSVDASANTLTISGHGLTDNVFVTFTGTVPDGITAGLNYYVINDETNTFSVSTTLGGSAVDITGTQTGAVASMASTPIASVAAVRSGNDATGSVSFRPYINGTPTEKFLVNSSGATVTGDLSVSGSLTDDTTTKSVTELWNKPAFTAISSYGDGENMSVDDYGKVVVYTAGTAHTVPQLIGTGSTYISSPKRTLLVNNTASDITIDSASVGDYFNINGTNSTSAWTLGARKSAALVPISSTSGIWQVEHILSGSSQWTTTGSDIYFANKVGVGSTDAPAKIFHVKSSDNSRLERTSTATNNSGSASESVRTTSNDMADGFGVCHLLSIQDSAAVVNGVAQICAVRAGGDTTADFTVTTANGGAPAEKFRVTAAGIGSFQGGGSANKAICWKSDGKTLGYCSSAVDSGGGCTCN